MGLRGVVAGGLMAIEVIKVAAVTSPNLWVLGAGANKVVAVNAPSDDDASYIYDNVRSSGQQYSLVSTSIPVGSTINSVSVFSRCRKTTGSGVWDVVLRLGAASTTGPSHGALSTYSEYTDALARPGGGIWALSDFSTLEVKIVSFVAGSARCTSLWLIVDYTPPPSAFFHLFP